MSPAVINALWGGLGGAIKSAFGACKNTREKGEAFKYQWKYLGITLVEGMVGGIALGIVLPSPVGAFLGGLGINELADLNDLFYPKTKR
jgi:hypothetical protein